MMILDEFLKKSVSSHVLQTSYDDETWNAFDSAESSSFNLVSLIKNWDLWQKKWIRYYRKKLLSSLQRSEESIKPEQTSGTSRSATLPCTLIALSANIRGVSRLHSSNLWENAWNFSDIDSKRAEKGKGSFQATFKLFES